MIQEGLPYSYLTNGFAYVLLHVPEEDPSTLYYYLFEPNLEVNLEENQVSLQPKTAVDKVLCLCLMSFLSPFRDREWRNAARAQLHIWETNFDYTRSQIPEGELSQNPPDSDYIAPDHTSSEYTSSEYLPSSPISSDKDKDRRTPTRSRAGCAHSDATNRADSTDSDSDSNQVAPGRKRDFSQVTSSPPTQRVTRQSGLDAVTEININMQLSFAHSGACLVCSRVVN